MSSHTSMPEQEEPVAFVPDGAYPVAEQVLVRASRSYLAHVAAGQMHCQRLPATFEARGVRHVYVSWTRVLDLLVAHSAEPLQVRTACCRHLEKHERALVASLRKLSNGDDLGYVRAMHAVMPIRIVAKARRDMREVAEALPTIEQCWQMNPIAGTPNR